MLFRYNASLVAGTNRIGPGIDIRNDGGYIVVAPSIVNEIRYRWLSWPEEGAALVPDWIVEMVRPKQVERPKIDRPTAIGSDMERAKQALQFIPSDYRDTWLAVGMSLKGAFGESGRWLWDAWSAQSSKFDQTEQSRSWRSFKTGQRSLGTIFHLRSRYGGQPKLYSL